MEGRDGLVERLLEHCALACVTGEEGPLADMVTARYTSLGRPVTRVGNSVVVGSPPTSGRELVVLAGHLDVVPPTDDDLVARLDTRDGTEVVVGRGTSDMKAGNVVAMSLIEDDEVRAASPFDLALVLYAGEEGPADGNELRVVLDEVPWLSSAALAVLLEPTDGELQLGCLGGIHALVTFRGRAAHSARPWHGENALTKAGTFLTALDQLAAWPVDVDGIRYHDVWTATQAWTGVPDGQHPHRAAGRNVVPDTFTVNLNLRFAPSRGLAEAEAEVRELVGDRAEVEVIDRALPAPPRWDAPIVRSLARAVGAQPTGKQAWTDVARFTAVGVPAVNYGPGLTAQAHQRGEFVPVDAIVGARDVLHRFLSAPTPA